MWSENGIESRAQAPNNNDDNTRKGFRDSIPFSLPIAATKAMDYAELNAKTCYSFLTGASHPEEMLRRAKDLGYRAIAVIDQQGFYGMVRAYDASQKLSMPLLIGTEVRIENAALSLIAKDFTGYKQLCRMLSEAFSPEKQLLLTREHLQKWLCPQIQLLPPPRNFPSENFFTFLRSHSEPVQLVTKTFHPDLDKPLSAWLASLPKEIQRAWSWDPFFHEPSRFELSEILRAIRTNTPLSRLLPSPNGERYLKPLSMLEKYRVPKKWIHQTVEIAESCSFSPKEIRYHYPQEWLPKGKTPQEFLRELCNKGIQIRYQGDAPSAVRKQLEHELQLVRKLEFEDYFLTVWDIVHFARSKNILCQGRGSAANSVICYLLEITAIDPVQMNLLFERFISEERNEAPDIDVDFEHERREEVIQYVYEKYGRHRAGMVATLITYRTKSALRDVGKALDIPISHIEATSKKSSWRENVFADPPSDAKLQRWLKNAELVKGFPRHLGQHTGGMIISHTRLDEISPIEHATMEGRTLVQWDKYDIEKLGLLKIDLLSLGMLTCLRKTLALVNHHFKANLHLHSIPHDDKKTYAMIQKSATVGVFQIESRAQMTMLPRLKPKNFYDLVVEVGIIRPGPIQGGMIHPYLRRRMGVEAVTYAHPKLKPILEKTLGIPIFQEQVMKMAIEVAGYSPGEADALRRAMGAWKKRGNLEEHSEKICARLIQNGIERDFAEKVCQQILGFGEYGFPESHAASFALLTYASAYLKAHYPEAFFCGLLNSMPLGFYPFHMLTAAFQREGVHILPVHTEFSNWDHQMERLADGEGFGIRLGFRCVRKMRKENVERFVEQRARGSIDLFIFNQEERASLAMTSETDERREKYWKALTPSRDSLAVTTNETTEFPELHAFDSMLLDFKFMEATLKTHPVSLIKKHLWRYLLPIHRLTLSDELSYLNSPRAFVFGMVQVIQSPPTANGIFFLTLEDEKGFLNLVMKPPVYQKFKHLIQTNWTLLVSGRIQNQSGYVSILVEQILPPGLQTPAILSTAVIGSRASTKSKLVGYSFT